MKTAVQLLLTFLLNAVWLGALISVFAFACHWLLRDTAARYRHAVWVAALVLSLVLPVLSCATLIQELAESRTSAPEIVRPIVAVQADARLDLTRLRPPALTATEPAPREIGSIARIRLSQRWALALLVLYGLFILYGAGKLFRAWRRTRAIIRGSSPMENIGPLSEIVRYCQAAIGVKRVRIHRSSGVAVPITAGIMDPLIILPEHSLPETDEEVLISAVGHELVHIARHDYLMNLLYEFAYLPLSFHPALALVRRQIRRTRELCCDERVAGKLINAEQYARSLVRLIGSAPFAGRLIADTTIGIAESDILEVRIMSLLKKRNLTAKHKTFLLIAASILLLTPCVAAAKLGLRFDISPQEPAAPKLSQTLDQQRSAERKIEDLKRIESALEEKISKASAAERPEMEAKLKELHQTLAEHELALTEFDFRQNRGALDEIYTTLAQAQKGRDEAQVKELRDKLAELERSMPESKMRADQLEELLRLADEIELQQGQADKAKEKAEKDKLKVKDPELEERDLLEWREKEQRYRDDMRESIERSRAEKDLYKERLEEAEKYKMKQRVGDVIEMRRRMNPEDEQREREERSRREAELTRGATISMDRAIQIATSKYPGKVLACSLGRENGQLFYHVVVIGPEGDKSGSTYVWVSAVDGQILKTEKE